MKKIVELIIKHHSRLSLIESIADRLRSIFVESTKKISYLTRKVSNKQDTRQKSNHKIQHRH